MGARRGQSVDRVVDLVVGLVSCSKSKLPHRAPARELYSPSFVFDRSRAYVEAHCDAWHVLSAAHGLVDPDQELDPYDATLAGAPVAVRRQWSARVRAQLEELYEGKRVRFVLLAGAAYAGCVEGLDVEQPLAGMGTGHRRSWLSRNTRGM